MRACDKCGMPGATKRWHHLRAHAGACMVAVKGGAQHSTVISGRSRKAERAR